MSFDIDVAVQAVRTPVAASRIARIARTALRAERVNDALLSITLVNRASIARLNRRHLGHAGATDVLSFGFNRLTPADPVIGDIYIAPEVAREHARARGERVREEIARLVVHGVLHVLGYDHPTGDGRENSEMWRRQEQVLRRLSRVRR